MRLRNERGSVTANYSFIVAFTMLTIPALSSVGNATKHSLRVIGDQVISVEIPAGGTDGTMNPSVTPGGPATCAPNMQEIETGNMININGGSGEPEDEGCP